MKTSHNKPISHKLKHEKKYLILESQFDSNYKLYIYIFFLFALGMPFIVIMKTYGLIRIVAIIGFIAILFLGVSIWFMKKGFMKNSHGLHIGYFSWGKLVFTEHIRLLNKPKVTILKFRKRERAGFVSIANPEFSQAFNAFDIYLLNEKHTVKKQVISFKSEKNAQLALNFLTSNSKLKHEIYSPDFS